jgi:hypothetical protein
VLRAIHYFLFFYRYKKERLHQENKEQQQEQGLGNPKHKLVK